MMDPMAVDERAAELSVLETDPSVVQPICPFLDIKTLQALRGTSKALLATLQFMAGPLELTASKSALDCSHNSSCRKVFERWGHRLTALTLHRTAMSDRATLPTLLGYCCSSLRRLSLHDLEASGWSVEGVGAAILSAVRLEELRLHASDLATYDAPGGPFAVVVRGLPAGRLPYLRKLTLFSRLDAEGNEALAAYLQSMDMSAPTTVYTPGLLSSPYTPALKGINTGAGAAGGSNSAGGMGHAFSLGPAARAGQAAGQDTAESTARSHSSSLPCFGDPSLFMSSIRAIACGIVSGATGAEGGAGAGPPIQGLYGAARRLIKLKLSTSVISSPGGSEVLAALSRAAGLQKLTIMRPEGLGEPIRKAHCILLGRALVQNTSLHSLHLRRAGMWTDTLAALVPTAPCRNVKNLKLDSNSLGYLSGTAFNDAIDALLARLPCLEALHAGNNTMCTEQAIALARSIKAHKLTRLENLTLGSNDIGDAGLDAILKVLPCGMKQLYLHGCDLHDGVMDQLRDALDRMPLLWGLGLNGNPVSDSGVRTLARALRHRPALRDVGITLSEMTDEGVVRLANALKTCPNMRFVYLYTQGYKAATKVTDEGKRELKLMLPSFATPAFDHRLSRYLKQP